MSKAKKVLNEMNDESSGSQIFTGTAMVAVTIQVHSPYELEDVERVLQQALELYNEGKEATVSVSYMPTTFEESDGLE